MSGGQAGTSSLIRNYPGFVHGVAGEFLADRACEQAWLFGASLVFTQEVIRLRTLGGRRTLQLAGGKQLACRAVVLATGVSWRRLGIARLEALIGSGVFYGVAASEAQAMAGQTVAVVGAGNGAGQAAIHLAKHARDVTIVARGDSLERSMSRTI